MEEKRERERVLKMRFRDEDKVNIGNFFPCFFLSDFSNLFSIFESI